MKIRLIPKEMLPESGKIVFLLRNGCIGLGFYQGGHWYSLPNEGPIDNIDFYWIDMN